MNGGHYLKKNHNDAMPGNAAVIAWIQSREKADGSDRIYKPGFVCGRLIRWRNRNNEQICRFSLPLNSAEETLGHVERQAMGGSLTWVFTFGLKQFLAAAGFWDQVLQGTIDLWGADDSHERTDEKGGKRKWRGYVVLESPPAIVCCRFRPRGGTVKFVDLANYNLDGWQKLAEYYSPEKPSAEEQCGESFSLADLAEHWALAAEHWLTSLWQVMTIGKLGNWQATGAAQAQYTFRRAFMDHDILAHSNMDAKRLERQALYGGRCEAAFIGKVESRRDLFSGVESVTWGCHSAITNGPIYQLDVNSMYPSVAHKALVPARLDEYTSSPQGSGILIVPEGRGVIADVTVEVDKPLVPVTDNGLTIFPIGRFRTQLCGPEIDLVAKHGHILQCHSAATYFLEPLFYSYVEAFWQLRLTAKADKNKGLAKWTKIMLLALFGKFAQRSKRWVSCPERNADEPFDQWVEEGADPTRPDDYRSLAWEVEKLTVIGEHKQSVPSITAWINSLGRVRLWNLMSIAGRDQVFYYDTDSLWTTQLGLERLTRAGQVDGDALGLLKVEGSYRTVEFRGIKHYVADGLRTCAGQAKMVETSSTAAVEAMQELPLGFDLARQQAPSGQTYLGSHRYIGAYKHGIVLPDGRVQPHQIGRII